MQLQSFMCAKLILLRIYYKRDNIGSILGRINFRFRTIHSSQNHKMCINPLNAKLNPICHLLALLGADPILHFSRIRVNHSEHNSISTNGTQSIYSINYMFRPLHWPSSGLYLTYQVTIQYAWCTVGRGGGGRDLVYKSGWHENLNFE
jgi:hypothetical protein